MVLNGFFGFFSGQSFQILILLNKTVHRCDNSGKELFHMTVVVCPLYLFTNLSDQKNGGMEELDL